MSARRWLFIGGALAVMTLAASLRLPDLALRPMHADEANQAVKTGILWEHGRYDYDVADHHGPSLYWLTLPVLRLSGAEDFAHSDEWAYRLVPVAFSLGVVALVFLLADGLGRAGALAAGLLTAISPAMVYFSRYYIQEMLLVFFTTGAIVAGWRYARSRRIGWAVALGVCIGMMHATKETWVLSAAAMTVALAAAVAMARWRDGATIRFREFLRPLHLLALLAAAAVVATAFYSGFGRDWAAPWRSILAYVSYWHRGSRGGENGMHTHPWNYYFELLFAYRPARGFFWTEGLIAGLAAVGTLWSLRIAGPEGRVSPVSPAPVGDGQRARAASVSPLPLAGEGQGVRAGSFASGQSITASPSPQLSSAVPRSGETPGVTAVEGVHQRQLPSPLTPLPQAGEGNPGPNPHLVRFLTVFTLVLTLLYTIIPYKTPWCSLSFLQGMILLAGAGVWAIMRGLPGRTLKTIALLLLAAGAIHLGREARALSFRFAADARNPYVYAHTPSDTVALAKRLEQLAQRAPEGHDLMIHVIADNSWPLPWYLRRFNEKRVGYWQDAAEWSKVIDRVPPPAVVIFTTDVQPRVDAALRGEYNKQMICGLRGGVLLQVYIREDLWPLVVAEQ